MLYRDVDDAIRKIICFYFYLKLIIVILKWFWLNFLLLISIERIDEIDCIIGKLVQIIVFLFFRLNTLVVLRKELLNVLKLILLSLNYFNYVLDCLKYIEVP